VVWDGTGSNGDRVYGTFTCALSATCDEGQEASARTTVTVQAPLPSIDKIEFPRATSLVDDQGTAYRKPAVYFEEGREHHPVLLTADLLSSAADSNPVQSRQVNAGEDARASTAPATTRR